MQHPNTPHLASLNRGFTLIEILVVVIIISISIGVVLVNFTSGTDDELAEDEITRLQQLLRFAHQQSVIRAEEYGVRFYTGSYRFMYFNEDSQIWTDISNDKLLRSRTLSKPLELDLYIEQLPLALLESAAYDPKIPSKNLSPLANTNAGSAVTNQAAIQRNSLGINPGGSLGGSPNSNEQAIKPQVFLLSSSELTPQFEVRLRIPGSDVEKTLFGLPQGEYLRSLPDE